MFIDIEYKKAVVIGSENDLKQISVDHIVSKGDFIDIIYYNDEYIICRKSIFEFNKDSDIYIKKYKYLPIHRLLIREINDLKLNVILDN